MKAWPRYAVLAAFAAVLIVLVTINGYRYGLWDLGVLFGVLRPMTFVLLGGAAVSIVAAVALGLRREVLGTLAAVAVAITAGGLGALPLWMSSTASRVPPIHDITTDVGDPPAFVAILPLRADASNPPEYDTEQTNLQLGSYPDIRPLVMPEPLPEAYAIAIEAVRAEGLEIVAAVPGEGRIEAVETVPLFGFKDDVVIRMRNAHGIATVIDIRSKSRVGRSDLGFNAARIRSLIDRMEEKGGRLEMDAEMRESRTI